MTPSGRCPTGSSAELTAHRTLALRDAVAANPQVAMPGACCTSFVLTAFYQTYPSGRCLEVGLRTSSFPAQTPD